MKHDAKACRLRDIYYMYASKQNRQVELTLGILVDMSARRRYSVPTYTWYVLSLFDKHEKQWRRNCPFSCLFPTAFCETTTFEKAQNKYHVIPEGLLQV